MWVPRIEPRLSGLEASIPTQQTISLAPLFLNYLFGFVETESFLCSPPVLENSVDKATNSEICLLLPARIKGTYHHI